MITKKTIGDIEYLSANDVFLKWSKGKYVKKQKGQFLSNKGTKCLIEKLNEIHNSCYVSFRGNSENSGTWMIPEMIPYFHNWLNKLPAISFSKNESIFCDIIESSFNGILSFHREYCFDMYRVDLYCPQLNLCIEYDEEDHVYKSKQDNERQKYIEDAYNCTFIRHNHKDNVGCSINKLLLILNKQ